jgi:hypothetical protein
MKSDTATYGRGGQQSFKGSCAADNEKKALLEWDWSS